MRISDWSSDVCSSDLGRAFDEALDPSAPPASFAQQQLPGAEILAGREEALVHRQTVLAPGVHVRGPGLYAVHHPAWDLLPDLVDADHVGGALLDQAVAVMRDQIAMVLPTLLDGERTDGKIGNGTTRTPATAELPIPPPQPARGQEQGVALMETTHD